MSGGTIPSWNLRGVLPPVDPNYDEASSINRSPYVISLNDFVSRFGTSTARLEILNGFLSFRSALHGIGLIRGFQWLDGSFTEDCELLRSRSPNDIDVVTFYYPPANQTQEAILKSNPQLFDLKLIKSKYHVDAYFVNLSSKKPETLVSKSAYWYGVWSHQRKTLLWKGYLQMDLSPTDDHIALDNVRRIMGQGGAP
jgi:hypothetical protein